MALKKAPYDTQVPTTSKTTFFCVVDMLLKEEMGCEVKQNEAELKMQRVTCFGLELVAV